MDDLIQKFKQEAQKVIDHFKADLKKIRTGRAQSSLVDSIVVEVEAYGGNPMKLQELASISTPDASLIVIQPFDPNVMKDVERALQEANLGMNPVVDQNVIRLAVPALTQERRQEMIKLVAQKTEEARIGVRNIRNDIKQDIEDQEGSDGVSEDMIHQQLEQLQKSVDEVNNQLTKIKEDKEKDLLEL